MNFTENAISLFRKGMNCAQALVTSYAESAGIEAEELIKSTVAFGGGMAYAGEVCGAVTGAVMIIGVRHGGTLEGDDRANEIAAEFIEKFKARHPSVRCRDLTGYDISTHGKERIAAKRGAYKKCAGYVRDAGQLLRELL